MQRIAIFGSTGSIGAGTLDICRQFPLNFSVVALSAHSRIDILLKQVEEFHPRYVGVADPAAAARLKRIVPENVKVFGGSDGLSCMARQKGIDKIVMAISGAAALPIVWSALEHGRTIALANKEALVMAGPLVMAKAKAANAQIIPIDSEQSAIWQCIADQDKRAVRRLYLTASGGPLRGMDRRELKNVSIAQVLKHPRWKMGRKISVDSATLMNKGLELIEAMFLFGVGVERVSVVIHPESIVHSMAEFVDGVVMAQLSATDMRIPIQYALSYPKRLPSNMKPLDFFALNSLHFEKPDVQRFPCLRLAYEAARQLGTAPAVMNAANEIAVGAFLQRRIGFTGIPRVVERVLSRHVTRRYSSLDEVYAADRWARDEALCAIGNTRA